MDIGTGVGSTVAKIQAMFCNRCLVNDVIGNDSVVGNDGWQLLGQFRVEA